MSVKLTLDDREFRQALREYRDATKKDAAYVVNRQALNVTIKAIQNTPASSVTAIAALEEKEWWPKYIAKRISLGVGFTVKRKGKTRTVRFQGAYTRPQARLVSRKIIAARKRTVGFIRSGWLPALQKFKQLKIGSARGVGRLKQFGRPKGSAIIAVPGFSPTAFIINSAEGAVKISGLALQQAFILATVDMRKFIAERFGPTAKKFSAK